MARIITKEHAEKIAKKLNARFEEGKAHAYAEIFYKGKLISRFGIRRGSKKDSGHDHVQRDLSISGFQAKLLAACPLSREDWLQLIREKGLLD